MSACVPFCFSFQQLLPSKCGNTDSCHFKQPCHSFCSPSMCPSSWANSEVTTRRYKWQKLVNIIVMLKNNTRLYVLDRYLYQSPGTSICRHSLAKFTLAFGEFVLDLRLTSKGQALGIIYSPHCIKIFCI